jgi:hypothetical protein
VAPGADTQRILVGTGQAAARGTLIPYGKEHAMYGTIFRLQPRVGREADVVSLMEEWNRQRGATVPGVQATYLLRSERRPGELIGAAVFDDEQTYRANAAAPEQDAWHRRLRAALEADPIWEDGEYLLATHFSEHVVR